MIFEINYRLLQIVKFLSHFFLVISSVGDMSSLVIFATIFCILIGVLDCIRVCNPNGAGPPLASILAFMFLKKSKADIGTVKLITIYLFMIPAFAGMTGLNGNLDVKTSMKFFVNYKNS